jgi:hypothetical protein
VTVAERARERGIERIVHYTSNRGVMGAVANGALLSREQVENDPGIAFIYEGIWERKDHDWVDYISLSVSRINVDLFERSRKHFPDFWWAVMSFDVEILDHHDVWFTTTNNVYEEVLDRRQGLDGFEALFQESVAWGYRGSRHHRWPGQDRAWPTDRAAEVLYPTRLPLEFLRTLHLPDRDACRLVKAWCEVYGRDPLPQVEDLAIFT